MVGGEESIFREVKEVLRAVGTNVGYMGPIGAGTMQARPQHDQHRVALASSRKASPSA
jgi:hypothetical protein